MYRLSMTFLSFSASVFLSSSSMCRWGRMLDGAGPTKNMGTPSLARLRYFCGKREKMSRDPEGYSNQSFLVALHNISCMASKSASNRRFFYRCFVVHLSPWVSRRKVRQSLSNLLRYTLIIKLRNMARLDLCVLFGAPYTHPADGREIPVGP